MVGDCIKKYSIVIEVFSINNIFQGQDEKNKTFEHPMKQAYTETE